MIYIIITTTILSKHGVDNVTHRENRYMNSIQGLLEIIRDDKSIKPVIVENSCTPKTYFDELQCDVVYTNNNQWQLGHKGVNELLDIKEVIKRYNIQDDDVIIKLTGRYKLLDQSFIHLVKKNMDTHDAFLKFFNVCTKQFVWNDCVLGLYAIKCKYMKDFNYACISSPEVEFAEHVRENIDIDMIMEVNMLNLECCFADDLRLLVV
jgi:hypothetical protein